MTVALGMRRSGPARVAALALGAVPTFVTRLRHHPPPEQVAFAGLVLLAGLATLGGALWSASVFPPVFLALPLMFGGLLLARKALRWLIVIVSACLLYDVLGVDVEIRPGGIVVLVVTGLIAYEFARSREETGLGGLRGDSVLVELLMRLERQGNLPELPAPWRAESVVKAADGGQFAGDFVVSAITDEGCLEVTLVDVSGKGVDAGTRSLLLLGALGGLLGAKEPQDFLAAANSYLVRQDWEEGFATAVHLSIDLVTGEFAVGSAGHPPAAHFDAGSGRWSLVEACGPALGLLPAITYEAQTGVLRPGDALLLYTDGLVEVPGRDLSVGIDKLLGEAERLVTRGFAGGGALLVDAVSEGSSDDRGLVLLWRTHQ